MGNATLGEPGRGDASRGRRPQLDEATNGVDLTAGSILEDEPAVPSICATTAARAAAAPAPATLASKVSSMVEAIRLSTLAATLAAAFVAAGSVVLLAARTLLVARGGHCIGCGRRHGDVSARSLEIFAATLCWLGRSKREGKARVAAVGNSAGEGTENNGEGALGGDATTTSIGAAGLGRFLRGGGEGGFE